jgi:hypothetical protein
MIDYTERQKELQFEREMDDFFVWAEEQSAKLEITVDYFLDEFV